MSDRAILVLRVVGLLGCLWLCVETGSVLFGLPAMVLAMRIVDDTP